MKYKIYRLIRPEHLQKKVFEDHYVHDVNRFILEEPRDMYDTYDSVDEAMQELNDHKVKNECFDFTILPVISIDFEGKII